jgi:hypothetical protein
MQTIAGDPSSSQDRGELLERAEHHANEAERLLKSWWLSSHVQGQVHATLALYYATRHRAS